MSEKVKKFFEKKSNKIICGVATGVIFLGAAGGITACALVKKNKNAIYAVIRAEAFTKAKAEDEWIRTGYQDITNNKKGLPTLIKDYALDKDNNPVLSSEMTSKYDDNGYLTEHDWKMYGKDGQTINYRIKQLYEYDSFGNEVKMVDYDFKKDYINVDKENVFYTEYIYDENNRVKEASTYVLNEGAKEYDYKYTYSYFKDSNRVIEETSYYYSDGKFVENEKQILTCAEDGKLIKYEMFDTGDFVKKVDFEYLDNKTVKCVEDFSQNGSKSDSEIVYTFKDEKNANNIDYLGLEINEDFEGLSKVESKEYEDYSKTNLYRDYVATYSYDKHGNVSSIEEVRHEYDQGELSSTSFYKEAYTYEKIK